MRTAWPKLTLNDVCLRVGDGAHQSPASVEDGMPMASVKDLTPSGITVDTCRRISVEDFGRLARQGCKPQVGDVLIAKDGATALDTVCEIKEPLEVVLLSSVAILRPDTTKVLPSFLKSFLDAAPTRSYMKNAFTTGAAIPRVVLKDFKRAIILLPPLVEQAKICGIICAYDDLIENNTRRIQILEQMAQALYREWFVNFRFPGHSKVKLVESPMGNIPHGWVAATFGGMADISRTGLNPPNFPDEHFWHYSIPSFDAGRMPLLQKGIAILSNKFLVEADCVLLSKLNPRIPRVWLPRIDTSHRALASTEFLVFKTRPSFSLAYLFCLCCSAEFLSVFAGRALGTSTSHQRVKPDDLLRLPVVLPPSGVVQAFTESVTPLLAQIHTLRLKTANLRRTRDLLLPRLISGALDVSNLAIEASD
jgi:type I restriction enzyme S subunit